MRTKLVVLLSFLLAGMSALAQASVISSLASISSDPLTVTLTGSIQDGGAPAGYLDEYITRVDYTFDSGDGQSVSGSLTGLHTTALTLDQTFNYSVAGTYDLSFTAHIFTDDSYNYWVDTSYWVSSGYSQCDFWFFGCLHWHWVDTSHWVYQGYTATGVTPMTYDAAIASSAQVEAAPTPTPEPVSIALVGTALFGVALTRRRDQAKPRPLTCRRRSTGRRNAFGQPVHQHPDAVRNVPVAG